MRIVHVDHSPVVGGAERSVLELAKAQRLLGHQVIVAVGGRGSFTDALSHAGVEWRDLHWAEQYVRVAQASTSGELVYALPGFARAASSLRKVIRSLRPDVVQAHTRKSQLVATIALADMDVPLVWHLRDDLPTRWFLRVLILLALRRADHAVGLSSWLVQSYARHGALPRSGRIGLVPSGVDPQRLACLDTPWLSGARQPVIGYVGQIARWKGPHLLVDAAEELGRSDVAFRIIGGVWFPAEEAYGEWLHRRVVQSPAGRRLKWLPTTRSPEEAFAEIDVLAHTSISPEPFGRVLVEAMLARRPIIALRRGAPGELLDDDTALFAARADGVALARAISLLIDDRAGAHQRADRAAATASRYAPASVAAVMDGEYAQLTR